MALRTYIPGILVVANYLKKYVNSNSERLKSYMGDGLFALLVLVVDLVIIIAELITANKPAGDAWSDFTAVNTLSSTDINQIQGAIDKFYATIGVTP